MARDRRGDEEDDVAFLKEALASVAYRRVARP